MPNANVLIAAGSTTVSRGQTRAYVIESRNKIVIDSIYKLYSTFITSSYSSSFLDVDFKMIVPKRAERGRQPKSEEEETTAVTYALHVEGALDPADRTRRAPVQCRTLGNYMNDQTGTMPNDRLLRMLDMLQNQAQDLEGLNLAVPYYGLDDVLIINDSFFCFINDDKLFEFNPGTRRMDVTRPISRANAFYAPELKGRLHALPYELDYRASFYSLGLLTAFCALLKWDLVVNADADADVKKKGTSWRTYSESELAAMLDPIKHSKIYWFVLRCCRDDANRRLCVFV